MKHPFVIEAHNTVYGSPEYIEHVESRAFLRGAILGAFSGAFTISIGVLCYVWF